MLVRIFFDERWIPVNLPFKAYTESFLEDLTDKLKHKLMAVQNMGTAAGWDELQMIELEPSPDGWEVTLYPNDSTRKTENFYLY
ncbi:hypothetical protein [Paenibacillus eucommiae]|uniref:Uncharacterized protein n=1 Tax=Paenibacillus eucommiae TaxID=1355755 RepID=A0ABS4IY88_9BACL|nr:hypothetical protein [Paenibacillus eucommiae]MBP1991841.1 hypothetical protein [Paenibacillus eucommiae]